MEVTVIGIDLAKNIFQLHGVDAQGNTIVRKRLSRNKLLPFLSNLQSCLIGIEACGSANHWTRQFTALGHTVRQISPQRVKPYVSGNKNDYNDAAAICEAVTRPNMPFVPLNPLSSRTFKLFTGYEHDSSENVRLWSIKHAASCESMVYSCR